LRPFAVNAHIRGRLLTNEPAITRHARAMTTMRKIFGVIFVVREYTCRVGGDALDTSPISSTRSRDVPMLIAPEHAYFLYWEKGSRAFSDS
jgi:hypothetical protein